MLGLSELNYSSVADGPAVVWLLLMRAKIIVLRNLKGSDEVSILLGVMLKLQPDARTPLYLYSTARRSTSHRMKNNRVYLWSVTQHPDRITSACDRGTPLYGTWTHVQLGTRKERTENGRTNCDWIA